MQNNENKGEDYREVRKRQAFSEKEERTERALLFSFYLFSVIVFLFLFLIFLSH